MYFTLHVVFSGYACVWDLTWISPATEELHSSPVSFSLSLNSSRLLRFSPKKHVFTSLTHSLVHTDTLKHFLSPDVLDSPAAALTAELNWTEPRRERAAAASACTRDPACWRRAHVRTLTQTLELQQSVCVYVPIYIHIYIWKTGLWLKFEYVIFFDIKIILSLCFLWLFFLNECPIINTLSLKRIVDVFHQFLY